MSALYAELAAAPYERHESPSVIGPFECVRKFGQSNSSVYLSPDTVALCIRGTNPKNPQDLASDAALAFGKLRFTTRYKEIKSRFRQLLRDYPNHKIIVVGHSLGGTLAAELLNEFPNEIDSIHIFNPGAGIDSILKGTKGHILASLGIKRYKAIRRKTHIYHIKGDIISFLSRILPGNHIEGKNKEDTSAHSLANFQASEQENVNPNPQDIASYDQNKPNLQGDGLKSGMRMRHVYANMTNSKLIQLLRSLGYNQVGGLSKHEMIKILAEMDIGRSKKRELIKMYGR